MKKIVAILALCLSFCVGFAQLSTPNDTGKVMKTKKGRTILPAKGDVALGFGGVPMINFLLNLPYNMSKGTADAGSGVAFTSSPINQIVGKYYLDAKIAIRVRVGLNTVSGSVTNPVQNSAALAAAQQGGSINDIQTAMQMRVNDKLNFSKSVTIMSAGYEKRRGYGRLQGFYGAEVFVGCIKNTSHVTYGNAFSNTTQAVYTTDFNAGTTSTLNPATPTPVSRGVDTVHTASWVFGLRGFVGVEYFLFPKISIGAEFGWAYSIGTQHGYTVTSETYYNGQSGPVDVKQTLNIAAGHTSHGFTVDKNNNSSVNGASGAILLLFHF